MSTSISCPRCGTCAVCVQSPHRCCCYDWTKTAYVPKRGGRVHADHRTGPATVQSPHSAVVGQTTCYIGYLCPPTTLTVTANMRAGRNQTHYPSALSRYVRKHHRSSVATVMRAKEQANRSVRQKQSSDGGQQARACDCHARRPSEQ